MYICMYTNTYVRTIYNILFFVPVVFELALFSVFILLPRGNFNYATQYDKI